MKDIYMFDSWQAHLPVQKAWTSNSFTRSDTVVVIDSKLHQFRMCKTSGLFALLAVRVHMAVPLFRFTLQQGG